MSTCDDRKYGATTWMRLNYIGNGFAEARLNDGTSARIQRQLDGTWQGYVRAGAVGLPKPSWEDAIREVEHALAGEGIWLRIGG